MTASSGRGALASAAVLDVPVTARSVRAAVRALDQLPAAAWPQEPYRRSAFGPAWVDVDRNGCNQRDDVLLRDSARGTAVVARQGQCDHDVTAGTWLDPYTGRSITLRDAKDFRESQEVQIDHLVPLGNAWATGASTWPASRRVAFANSLPELVAVSGAANMAKSDHDPSQWLPQPATRCAYAIAWVTTKTTWSLGVTGAERTALQAQLHDCPR